MVLLHPTNAANDNDDNADEDVIVFVVVVQLRQLSKSLPKGLVESLLPFAVLHPVVCKLIGYTVFDKIWKIRESLCNTELILLKFYLKHIK